ncbi:hypothetical protein ACFOEM_08760 [Paenalcaligenes hominis]|uniref:hypothetical protein n=1 Tax=Paenalcaligenes hominis TaxID=643674 RepID=UPI003618EDE0
MRLNKKRLSYGAFYDGGPSRNRTCNLPFVPLRFSPHKPIAVYFVVWTMPSPCNKY